MNTMLSMITVYFISSPFVPASLLLTARSAELFPGQLLYHDDSYNQYAKQHPHPNASDHPSVCLAHHENPFVANVESTCLPDL
jgi:hypothetical protein